METARNRRNFIKTSAAITMGLVGLGINHVANAAQFPKESTHVIGPIEGYTPQIGTLVSMLNYNRHTILNMVKSLTMEQLDYVHDADANSIGALILHLGATDKFYQINTFEGRQELNAEETKEWGDAMNLGDAGRKNIKGHDVKYYIDKITTVREKTLAELKKKDDEWLLAVDPIWSEREPLNTYWKWFHVCEHESNHRGQIAFLQSRLPGAKKGGE